MTLVPDTPISFLCLRFSTPPPPPRFFLCRLSAGFAGLSEQPEIAARNFSTIAKDDIGEFWEWETGTNGIAAGTVGGACGHWRVDPRKVARDVKLGLLKNHFRPDRKFSFPARQVGKKQLKFQCSWLEQNQFAEVYADDLPTGNNLVTFKAELEHWELLLEGIDEQSLPRTAVEALRFAQGKLCPCIFQLLLLVSTWPVTTCSCERSV